MPSDPTRDVARNLRRLWDHILSLEEHNDQPEEVVVPTQPAEDLISSDAVTADALSGNDKYGTYDQDPYDFREFK
jgi:hypothetical protein